MTEFCIESFYDELYKIAMNVNNNIQAAAGAKLVNAQTQNKNKIKQIKAQSQMQQPNVKSPTQQNAVVAINQFKGSQKGQL